MRTIYCSHLYGTGDKNMLFNVGRGYTVKLDDREVYFVAIYYKCNCNFINYEYYNGDFCGNLMMLKVMSAFKKMYSILLLF